MLGYDVDSFVFRVDSVSPSILKYVCKSLVTSEAAFPKLSVARDQLEEAQDSLFDNEPIGTCQACKTMKVVFSKCIFPFLLTSPQRH